MFDIGTKEIIIISVVLLFLFGPKKLPELAKTLVDAGKNVKQGFEDKPEPKPDEKKDGKDDDKIEVRVNKKK